MERVILNDGEYEIIEDFENKVFKCLRYGEEWRNLVGDNLVLSMMYRIQELEKDVEDHRSLIESMIDTSIRENYGRR